MEGIQHRPECPNPDHTTTITLMSQREHYRVELHRCEHCGRSALIERHQPLGDDPK